MQGAKRLVRGGLRATGGRPRRGAGVGRAREEVEFGRGGMLRVLGGGAADEQQWKGDRSGDECAVAAHVGGGGDGIAACRPFVATEGPGALPAAHHHHFLLSDDALWAAAMKS